MKIRKIIVAIFTSLVLTNQCICAVGSEQSDKNFLKADTVSIEQKLEEFTADSVIVTEEKTGKVLFEKSSGNTFYSSHLTKLMTLLIVAEKLDSSDIKLSDKFTASAEANSQKAPQIWLDKGEKISVEELIKAVTVGNANDAAVTLAENISKSQEEFVSLMNERCKDLNMKSTKFVDCTGVNEENITTVSDMSVLCRELLKYKNLTQYLTAWIENVRDGKAELVNSNRLVRTYKGMTGMKACTSKSSGSCICATAQRNGMSICVVLAGATDNDSRDSETKQLLDMSFESYQLYSPEIPKELLVPIAVTGGEELECKVEIEKTPAAVIPRGSSSSLDITTQKCDLLTAPVSKGQVCATINVRYGESEVCKVNIVAQNDIKKMNLKCGISKLLYNLLNL